MSDEEIQGLIERLRAEKREDVLKTSPEEAAEALARLLARAETAEARLIDAGERAAYAQDRAVAAEERAKKAEADMVMSYERAETAERQFGLLQDAMAKGENIPWMIRCKKALARAEKAEAERDEQQEAIKRAAKDWHEAHPDITMVWPGTGPLIGWLMDEGAKLLARAEKAERGRDEANARANLADEWHRRHTVQRDRAEKAERERDDLKMHLIGRDFKALVSGYESAAVAAARTEALTQAADLVQRQLGACLKAAHRGGGEGSRLLAAAILALADKEPQP